MVGFWIGGDQALEKGLSERHSKHVLQLQDELSVCSDEDSRQRILADLRESEFEYRSQVDRIHEMLF